MMGRRAADVTTPVPVLAVPALVGVHGLKTTGEDLLHLLGLHCSVGVQTSPEISRPPTQHSDQLTNTLPLSSDRNTQTSNSYINEETQYVDISRLTRSDNEKRAILKQKSGESKTKKEVTFKPLGDEASYNVTCTQGNRNRTYCFARVLENNPHFAGNITNVRPKLKLAAHYTNGSVVDSEAIGGISVDRNEGVPIKSGTFHERDQIRKQGKNTEHCGRTLLSSAAQHFGTLQKICSLCYKRQSVPTGAVSLCENNPAASASSLKSALTALSTGTHVHTSRMERNRNIKPNQHQITDSIRVEDKRKQTLHLNEKVRFGKTAHPTCPVQSRPNLITVLQTHAAGDQTSNQLANTLNAKTVNFTEATIEIKQDTNFKSFTEPTQDNKIPHPTSLTLTPQTETATKSNDPQSYSYSKVPRSPQCNSAQYNVPQNACGSVHTTAGKTLSPLTHSCAAITRPGNATKTNTHKKTSAHLSTKVTSPRIQNVQKVQSTNTTQVATNRRLQISKKSPNSIITVSDSNLHHLSIVAPQSPLNEHAASDQAMHTSTKTIQARQNNLININAEPLFHESGATTSSPCICNSTQCISLKKSSVSLKNAPSSMPKENQSNELRHNQTSYTNKPNHENQLVVCKQENHSKTNPLTLSRLLTLSKKQNRNTDGSTNNPESLMNVSTELHTDENKLSSNVSNKFVEHKSKQHENSNLSQVTKLQNFISIIKSTSSCLHNHVNTEQHSQRYTKSQGYCDPSPLVQTAQETDVKLELFALGSSCKHTNTKAESSADNQPPFSYSTISKAQTSFMSSFVGNSRGHIDHITQSRAHQHTDSHSQLSFTAPVPFKNNGGPEYNLIPTSATSQAVAPPCLQSSEVEGDSTLSPAPTQLCPEDSSLTHSHPADVATLFPPSSPWCWKPAILQQKLETVEANLAANKDRITTLLNIIHDLEMCHTPASGRRCFKTGQDIKTCSTCQTTACIVYSVEYDFRQQEICFLEVLNFSPRRNNPSSAHLSEPFNFNLLRTVIKSLAKAKVKSKKLFRTMFKWLPRKTQQA